MPKNEVLRVEMIQLHHDILVADYGRKWKTIELVMRNYQWPEMTKDMEKYIAECDMCQRMKNRTEIPTGKLKLSKVAVVATTSQKTNSNTSNKSQDGYQVEITRELNKEFLMYCYSIYIKFLWFMLIINSPTLMSICSLCFHHISTSYLL